MLTGVDGYFPHPLTGDAPVSRVSEDFNAQGHRISPDFWRGVRDAMMAHAGEHIASGGRLNHVTRHMVGLFQGWPGARRYRQILSADATRAGAGPEVIAAAFETVLTAAAGMQAAE